MRVVTPASGRDTTVTFLTCETTTGYSRRISATCSGGAFGETITTGGPLFSIPLSGIRTICTLSRCAARLSELPFPPRGLEIAQIPCIFPDDQGI
jgi:hypothetical protein